MWTNDVAKLNAKLNYVIALLHQIQDMENKIMSDVTDALDELEKETTAISGAEDSAEAAFTRLAALILSLKDSQTDPATAKRITDAAAALKAKADALAAAVAASPTS